jgi:hypothetical protein
VIIGDRCPKCGRARADGADACARCGLVFARWTTKLHRAVDRSLDPESEILWVALLETWGDDARHDAFVKHCVRVGRLQNAGMRYRERLDADPNDATAARMQARIVGMATAALLPMRTEPSTPINRGKWFLWVVAIGAVGGILAGLFFQVINN